MANIGEKKSNFILFMISEFEFESHALLFLFQIYLILHKSTPLLNHVIYNSAENGKDVQSQCKLYYI